MSRPPVRRTRDRRFIRWPNLPSWQQVVTERQGHARTRPCCGKVTRATRHSPSAILWRRSSDCRSRPNVCRESDRSLRVIDGRGLGPPRPRPFAQLKLSAGSFKSSFVALPVRPVACTPAIWIRASPRTSRFLGQWRVSLASITTAPAQPARTPRAWRAVRRQWLPLVSAPGARPPAGPSCSVPPSSSWPSGPPPRAAPPPNLDGAHAPPLGATLLPAKPLPADAAQLLLGGEPLPTSEPVPGEAHATEPPPTWEALVLHRLWQVPLASRHAPRERARSRPPGSAHRGSKTLCRLLRPALRPGSPVPVNGLSTADADGDRDLPAAIAGRVRLRHSLGPGAQRWPADAFAATLALDGKVTAVEWPV